VTAPHERAGFGDSIAPQFGSVGWDGAACGEAAAGPCSVAAGAACRGGDTLTWIRVTVEVSGSTRSEGESWRVSGSARSFVDWSSPGSPSEPRAPSVTAIRAGAGGRVRPGVTVTTVRVGGFGTGASSATMVLEGRPVEEPGEDLGPVRRGEHLGDRGHGGETQASVAEGLDDLGVALDELGRGLAEERGGLGEPELLVEEGEEAGVAQCDPGALAIELRQGDQKVGHGVLLVLEQVGEAGGEGAALGGVHERKLLMGIFTPRPTRWAGRRRARSANEAELRSLAPRDPAGSHGPATPSVVDAPDHVHLVLRGAARDRQVACGGTRDARDPGCAAEELASQRTRTLTFSDSGRLSRPTAPACSRTTATGRCSGTSARRRR